MKKNRKNKGAVSTIAAAPANENSRSEISGARKSRQKKKSADILMFDEIFENGVIRDGDSYILCYKFTNLDYQMYSDAKKDGVYEKYQELLNSLPRDITYQELLINREFNRESLEKAMLPKSNPNNTEVLRNLSEDYAEIQNKRIAECVDKECSQLLVGVIRYKLSGKLDSPDTLFQLYEGFERILDDMNVKAKILSPEEVLSIYHEIYQPGSLSDFRLPNNIYRYGMSLSDYVAPSHICTDAIKYIEIGSKFSRALYIKTFGRTVDDQFLTDMLDHPYKIAISKHVRRLDDDESSQLLKNQLDSLEGQLEKRRETNAKRGTNYIPYRLRDKEKEIERVQGKLAESNCDLFEVGIFFYLSADSKSELEDLTKYLQNRAKKHQCRIDTLTRQQDKGLKAVLPLANNPFGDKGSNINLFWLTDELANLIPFSSVDYVNEKGICYGRKNKSRKLIVIDRTQELNANGFITGSSGAGKSMFVKSEMFAAMFKYPNDEFLIIDPENEYKPLIEPFGGTIVSIAPDSPTHLNLFDTDVSFSENGISAVSMKKEFIMMFVEQVKGETLTATERTIVNRCVTSVYEDYVNSNGQAQLPTLTDFYNVLKAQNSETADKLCDALELYISGSFDMFAHHTNIEYNNRFILFDINHMGDMLQIVGMQVLLELIWQRVRMNKKRGVRTWLWADEFSIVLNNEKSSAFFERVFQRIRKYGGVATGLTQNVENVFKNARAVNMFKNSEFVVLLRQKDDDLKAVLNNYDLSASQIKSITGDNPGHGIIMAGNKVIEFENLLDKNTEMYKICSTKFSEEKAGETASAESVRKEA